VNGCAFHEAPSCCDSLYKHHTKIVNTCSKKCIHQYVPTPVDRCVPYDVEVCKRVPVIREERYPVHVPVKVPVEVPVYEKEYVPCYHKKIIPVERRIYKQITNVVHVPKPVVCTQIKKVRVEVPIIKKEFVPVIKTCVVKQPVPVFETQVTHVHQQPACSAPPPPEPSCGCTGGF